jgi:hypothetical protein
MSKDLMLSSLVCGVLLISLHSGAKQTTKEGYQTATVVSVEKHVSISNYVGDDPIDAPLQPGDYSYDIGIRLECNVYVGRYESAIDYLPSIFAPNHSVDVRLRKHLIYVSLPSGDREVRLGIVSHRRLKEQECPANS